MEWKGLLGMIFRLCQWIMLLAYVNILWIIFTLLGGVIFGITPATAAMFAVVRKWIIGKDDIPVFRTFWEYYRAEFLKTNILGFTLFTIGFVIYFDLKIIEFQGDLLNAIFLSIMFLFAIIFTIILMYIFPVFVHYDLKVFQSIKSALLIGILHPIRTILMIMCVITTYFLFRMIPPLLLFFSGSLLSILIMTFSYHPFIKIDESNNNDGQ